MKKTTLVIPCYNEGSRLPKAEIESFIAQSQNVDVLFVNDGSKDATLALITEIKDRFPQKVAVLNLVENQGKAEAVRQGILEVVGQKNADYVAFWDADLATPLTELPAFLAAVETGKAQFIYGARIRRAGAKIQRKWYRAWIGGVLSFVVNLLFRLNVRDTQCGAKVFSVGLAEKLFKERFISRWLFDIELFAKTKQYLNREERKTCFQEIPLNEWEEKGNSRIRLINLLGMPFELLRIYWLYAFKKRA